ncbi:MAG: BatA domain-containing protein, partial [Pseudomonadota bacterium]
MSFANPAALGLLGLLAVPILIHLLAQGEYRVVSVGSLRWLQSQQQPRWSRLQLRDPWRLALRCGLVAAMVLALAQPEWSVGSSQTNTQVLVDPSADMAAAREAVREVRARAQSTGGTLAIRWLSPGFPKWDASPPDEGDVPLYDLLAAADDTLAPGPLVVLAQAQADRLGWRRPTLARAVDWVALPGTVPGAERASPGRSVAVVHDGRPEVAAWVAAAIDAWAAGGGRTGDEVALYALPDLPPTYTPDWVVWLGAGEPWPPAVAALLAGGATVLSDTPGEITASVVLDLAGDEQPLFDVVRPPDPGEV